MKGKDERQTQHDSEKSYTHSHITDKEGQFPYKEQQKLKDFSEIQYMQINR
jgi:hypothetical protein